MRKRTSREVRVMILKALSDGNKHSYGNLERKVNTNWLSIRSHIEELQLMGAVDIRENKKIKILEFGLRLLIKLNGKG